MWQAAGIVRRTDALADARELLSDVCADARGALAAYGTNTQLVELLNLVGGRCRALGAGPGTRGGGGGGGGGG